MTRSLLTILMLLFLGTGPLRAEDKRSQEHLSQVLELVEEGSLREKLLRAQEENSKHLQLTVEEFEQYRELEHPWAKKLRLIETDRIQGLIKINLPAEPIVEEPVGKSRPEILDSIDAITRRAQRSTVDIHSGGNSVAQGMVVSGDGHICTKLSEVEKHKDLVCYSTGDIAYFATLVASDEKNDIAILKIRSRELPPVDLVDGEIPRGSFVASVPTVNHSVKIGVCTRADHSMMRKKHPVLGFVPGGPKEGGIDVVSVTPGSAAENAGLLQGDVIAQFDGVEVKDLPAFIEVLRNVDVKNPVGIVVLRNGKARTLSAKLGTRDLGKPTADNQPSADPFAGKRSQRRTEFPMVFVHDTAIKPVECGGPVVNLNGEVIGMNIARGGRTSTYAIPSSHLKETIDRLIPKKTQRPLVDK